MSLTCLKLPDLLSCEEGHSEGEGAAVRSEQHWAAFTNFSEFFALLPCCLLPDILLFLRNVGYVACFFLGFHLGPCYVGNRCPKVSKLFNYYPRFQGEHSMNGVQLKGKCSSFLGMHNKFPCLCYTLFFIDFTRLWFSVHLIFFIFKFLFFFCQLWHIIEDPELNDSTLSVL